MLSRSQIKPSRTPSPSPSFSPCLPHPRPPSKVFPTLLICLLLFLLLRSYLLFLKLPSLPNPRKGNLLKKKTTLTLCLNLLSNSPSLISGILPLNLLLLHVKPSSSPKTFQRIYTTFPKFMEKLLLPISLPGSKLSMVLVT